MKSPSGPRHALASRLFLVFSFALFGACGDGGGDKKDGGNHDDEGVPSMDASSGPDDAMPPNDAGHLPGADAAPNDDAGMTADPDAGQPSGPDGGEMNGPDGGKEPATCRSDSDCAKRCHPDSQTCVACRFDTDCGAGQWCRGQECVAFESCVSNDDCESPLVCDPKRYHCSVCSTDVDCPASHHCIDGERCEPFATCVNSLDCAQGLVCDSARKQCVDCIKHADCGELEACVRNECKPVCDSDKDCTGQGLLCRSETSPAAKFCAECTADVDCTADRHCAKGTCKPDVCKAGEQRCGESQVCVVPAPYCGPPYDSSCCLGWFPGPGPYVCNANGSAFEPVKNGSGTATPGCSSTQTCVESQGTATCKDHLCGPGLTHCNAERTAIVDCSDDGFSILSTTPCGTGTICDGTACIPTVCTYGAKRCYQNSSESCNILGTAWELVANCPYEAYCGEDTKNCLPTSLQSTLGTTSDWVSVSSADWVANFISTTDARKLDEFSFYAVPGSATNALTFFVYVETTAGNYTRVTQVASTNAAACASNWCGTTLTGVKLEAGKKYLLGVHTAATSGNHYFGTNIGFGFGGGASIDGGARATSATPPADVLTPGAPASVAYYMRLTTSKPD